MFIVLCKSQKKESNQPKSEPQSPRPRVLKFKPSSGTYLVNSRSLYLFLIYRDGQAQTDPYTPEYQIEKENVPEVLSIANLGYGKGLPASMAEMELIENMREKRAFENALPPTSDEACFVLRRKLMEE